MQRKVPLPGRIFARCILQRRFAGHFGCMARISCQGQPVFGCMARESCRELAIFPSEAAFGMHGAQNLPRTAARERTAAESCHGKTPGNASRAHAPRLPLGPRPWLRAPPPFAYATRHPDAAGLRVLQAVRALAVAQPADCRVAAERVVNIAKLVSVPQRRSARHHAPRCHAPQRHNAMLYGAMLHNAPRCNTMMPCAVRGAFVAAEKVSCGLRVSMR